MSIKPELKICWYIKLDKYSNLNRSQMEQMKIWSEFQMFKSIVLDIALENESDTLFLDSDVVVTSTLDDIDISKCLGVCPGFVNNDIAKKYGYFNGGMLWVKNKNIPEQWRTYTKKSRYYDQASIEDLYNFYKKTNSVFVFEDNYNLQSWRFILNKEPEKIIRSYLVSDPVKKILYYKKKPLKFIHTHFNLKTHENTNNFLIKKLIEARMYKILIIIYRVIHNKWIISLPKQPMIGYGNHKNDSFRELPILLKSAHDDIDIKYHTNSIHCKLLPNIILYDRPTLNWLDNEVNNSSLLLLGNCNVDIEGKIINKQNPIITVKPWIFWPRKPIILEKLLLNPILKFHERKITSIFIGNYENNVQEKYRKNSESWENVLSLYHCTKGHKHKFTHSEYLMKLSNSKYGLCLRGFGSKCHREVELMAFGTIPIITPEVCISSYMDPPIENTHYITAKNPQELKFKINEITEEKWNKMSQKCYEWYQRNVHSKNCWNTTIMNILYN
tara:strand:- start:5677 stop:7176 length:1500 start_codon:yes stop_codon:yes gene_type:complete